MTRAPRPIDAPETGGFILVGVIMFMLALTILGLSLFSLSSYEGQFFHASVSREQSLHNSESGLELVRALLAANSSRLEDSQYAVGQFGITRVIAYQANSVNPGDTTSRGPVRWDRDLFLVVAGRAGSEERTVESKFVPRLLKNPYHDLVTCGLGLSYSTANTSMRNVELQGKVWQRVQWPSDTAWTSQVNWSTGRPLDITQPPVPLADAFVDTKLAGTLFGPSNGTDFDTGSGGGNNDYILKLTNTTTSPRYYSFPTPSEAENTSDPEGDQYGFFLDKRVDITVRGKCIWVIPDGICFLRAVTIHAENNNAGTLVIVAKANGREPGHEGRGIWFEGGLDIVSPQNSKVFLVTQGDLSITHDHSASLSQDAEALTLLAGGDIELMGPNSGFSFRLIHPTTMNAIADDLLSQGALPAIVGGSGSSFAFSGASWKETRLP